MKELNSVILSLVLASVFWFIMFFPQTAGLANFWLLMFLSTGILGAIGFTTQRKHHSRLFNFKKSHVAVGILSSLLLYGIFFAGNWVSTQVLPFAKSQVSGIYEIRTRAPLPVIGLALFFWIAPAEEIYWRGFVQERLAKRFGGMGGFLIASLAYAAVHAFSLNLMLCLSALVCSLFWGALFLRYRSLWPVIISHAVWDVLVFVLAPIRY